MIELTPSDDKERALWSAALDLGELLAGIPWTLVGAQMVMLHAFEAGQTPGRTTGDLDLLFDVRAQLGATAAATKRLLEAGFVEPGRSLDGVAHRFTKGDVVVDILAPEGVGERASRGTLEGARTIQVPGGTQALGRTELVDVRLGEHVGRLPRPSLLGAILLKSRAVEAAPGEADKHRGDLAFLLGLIADPRSLALDLRTSERRWLKSRRELLDRANPSWRMTRRPDDAFVALAILLRTPVARVSREGG